MIARDELTRYRSIFENELNGNILTYWMKYAVRPDKSGFYGAVDLSNRPVETANQACVLNARILWTFSAAAIAYPDKGYDQVAHLACQALNTRFLDPLYGGFFMELSPSFEPVNDIKHTYAQAFVLYALCQYAAFHPSQAITDQINEFFLLLDGKTHDPAGAGYGEAFSRDWQPLAENRMADHNEPRSMNTHLHLLEAYAQIVKTTRHETARARLAELMDIFNNNIIRSSGHLGIFFDEEFNETKESQEICSFGHDIEASWLLLEAAEILGDRGILEQTRRACIQMGKAVVREGMDWDGGLFLESYRNGSHLRTNKHWWLQAEMLVGLMNLYEMTGDTIYWEHLKRTWSFIDTYVIDHQGGEWFTKVNRLGQPFLLELPSDPSPYYRNDWKVDPWKCPYHNGRACLESIKRIEKI